MPAFGLADVQLISDDGQLTYRQDGAPRPLPDAVRRAVATSLRSGRIEQPEVHGGETPAAPMWHDIIVPLRSANGAPKFAVVLRKNADRDLLIQLQGWPSPRSTGTAVLVRRRGDDLVGLYGRSPRPLSTANLLAARVIRGDMPAGIAFVGTDMRGTPSLGAVRPVAGSEWFLVARLSLEEVQAEAMRNTHWIIAAGALGTLGSVLLFLYLGQRRALMEC